MLTPYLVYRKNMSVEDRFLVRIVKCQRHHY